ncbi:MAG: hypothetical protein ABWJ42_01540 [Sulfolobales archaeon]
MSREPAKIALIYLERRREESSKKIVENIRLVCYESMSGKKIFEKDLGLSTSFNIRTSVKIRFLETFSSNSIILIEGFNSIREEKDSVVIE